MTRCRLFFRLPFNREEVPELASSVVSPQKLRADFGSCGELRKPLTNTKVSGNATKSPPASLDVSIASLSNKWL